MSAWWTVFRKEVIENARDRRALSSALLYGPLVGPVLFAALITVILGQQQDAAEKTLELPLIGAEYAPSLVRFLETQGVRFEAAPEDPEAAIRDQSEDVVLRIPESYPERWLAAEPARVDLLFDASRQTAQTTVGRVESLLQAYSRRVGVLRLQVRGIDPSVAAPVVVSQVDLSTPQSRAALLMAMLPYFLILSAFIGGMYLAIDTTAGERERQSLEPLLLAPVSRVQLAWGKLAATSVFAGASLVICVLAFALSMRLVPTAEFGLDLRLPLAAVLVMVITVLPVALLASGAQTVVASFSKSFREAQTYLQFLILIPALPSVIIAINPMKLELWMSAVPLLSQSLILTAVARGDSVPALPVLISILTTTLLAAVLGLITARLFGREKFALSG
jgi:sodium transport system permease protein